MGSAVAAALARGSARVVATLDGRSERTSRLAERAGVELLPDLDAVVRAADVIFSIVPPEAAKSVAETVRHAATGSPGQGAVRRAERDRSSDRAPDRVGTFRSRSRDRRRIDLRAAAVAPRDDARVPLWTTRLGDRSASSGGCRPDRRGRRRRSGLRREDEHRIHLQRQHCCPASGPTRRAHERRSRARSRRPPDRRARARLEHRASPHKCDVEVGPLRRRDA